VNVELEEMEEWIVDEVKGAVDIFLNPEEEFEGSTGLVAGKEGNVGQLALGVCDVFAGVASNSLISSMSIRCNTTSQLADNIRRSVQAAHGDLVPNSVPFLLVDQWLLRGSICNSECCVES